MSRAMVLVLAAAFGCATPIAQDGDFAFVEREYGIYSVANDEIRLLRQTTEIPCEVGATFGLKLAFDLRRIGRSKVLLDGELEVPEVPGFREPIHSILVEPPTAKAKLREIHAQPLFFLSDERDLVEGAYVFRLRSRRSGEVLHVRTFTIEDCP